MTQTVQQKDLMFIANLNVFIAVVAGMSYLFGWILGVPPSTICLPYGVSLVLALILGAGALLFIWSKWTLIPSVPRVERRWLYFAGNFGVTISSAVFVCGIVMSLQAASISREEEAWCWVLMLYYIGPVGAACLASSMALIFRESIARLLPFKINLKTG
jgi:hypothetical protein